MRCINEQLTKASDCLRFAADDLRGALADANAVQALVLLPLIADTTRLAQQVSALIEAMGACESEAQHKLDWDLIGKVMAKHGLFRVTSHHSNQKAGSLPGFLMKHVPEPCGLNIRLQKGTACYPSKSKRLCPASSTTWKRLCPFTQMMLNLGKVAFFKES